MLYSQMISQWNDNYSLQLEIDDTNDNVLIIGFYDNYDFFYDQNTGRFGTGVTKLPVEFNYDSEIFESFEYAENSLTEYNTAFVVFNSCPESEITWTTSTSPDGNYMLGTVILHEMGHV